MVDDKTFDLLFADVISELKNQLSSRGVMSKMKHNKEQIQLLEHKTRSLELFNGILAMLSFCFCEMDFGFHHIIIDGFDSISSDKHFQEFLDATRYQSLPKNFSPLALKYYNADLTAYFVKHGIKVLNANVNKPYGLRNTEFVNHANGLLTPEAIVLQEADEIRRQSNRRMDTEDLSLAAPVNEGHMEDNPPVAPLRDNFFRESSLLSVSAVPTQGRQTRDDSAIARELQDQEFLQNEIDQERRIAELDADDAFAERVARQNLGPANWGIRYDPYARGLDRPAARERGRRATRGQAARAVGQQRLDNRAAILPRRGTFL